MKAPSSIRLELRGIRKAFPTVVANDGVDLAVARGSIHAVLGENGAGKSTLMKIVFGLVRADAGTMLWDGVPIRITSPSDARTLGIGMVFQHFSLFPAPSVAENIALTLRNGSPLSSLAARAFEVSHRYTYDVRCGGVRAQAQTLSGGNLQRFVVGRELLQAPSVALVAQPTWGLDVRAAVAIRSSLLEMRGAGVAILLVSEDLDELLELSDRIAVIAAGRLSPVRRVDETDVEEIGRWMGGARLCDPRPDRPMRGDAASP